MSVTPPDHVLQFFGTIQNGQVVSSEPIDLPDGTAVRITAPDTAESKEDDGWDNSPEGIAAWLKRVESLEPLVFTEDERRAWEAASLARKEWEKAHFDEETNKLAALFK